MASSLTVERIGEVAVLRFANRGKRNAIDLALVDGLAESLTELPKEGVRAAVLTGAADRDGRTIFSAGFDIGALGDRKFVASPLTPVLDALTAGPMPVVAAVGGLAFGGGCALAVHCDLRVAHAGVELCMPPARLGLVYPAREMARFVALIGASRARELFLVGRPISAERALGWGLIDRIVDEGEVFQEALGLAQMIAENAPLAVAGMRRSFEKLMPIDPQVIEDLDEVARIAWESDDAKEAQRAFKERRKPRFFGR